MYRERDRRGEIGNFEQTVLNFTGASVNIFLALDHLAFIKDKGRTVASKQRGFIFSEKPYSLSRASVAWSCASRVASRAVNRSLLLGLKKDKAA